MITISTPVMIETINMLLLKKFEESCLTADSGQYVNRWLMNDQNYRRLQRECDKIWLHQFEDERYDIERAFKVLGRRLLGICGQENY